MNSTSEEFQEEVAELKPPTNCILSALSMVLI